MDTSDPHSRLGPDRDDATGLTDDFPGVLRDRSLPRRPMVKVRVGDRSLTVPNGVRLEKVLPSTIDARPVVAGLVDNRAASLSTPITGDVTVSPLTTAHWEGRRVHHHSLALLLMEAAYRVDPSLSVAMGASVGFAQRVIIEGSRDLSDLAERLQAEMTSLGRQAAPLLEEEWTVEEAKEHFLQVGWHDAAKLLVTWRGATVPLASYGHVYALRLEPLLINAGQMNGFKVVSDDDALILVYELDVSKARAAISYAPVFRIDDAQPTSPEDPDLAVEAQAAARRAVVMTAGHQLWLGTLGVTSVGAFNQACINGDVAQLIRVSESHQEKELGAIADAIRQRERVKMVGIAGPSSSGKTTLIKRLTVQLNVNGINPVTLNLDDYYLDRAKTPRSPDGDYDFEAVEALDLDTLQRDLQRLVAGEAVRPPRFDFTRGVSIPEGGQEIQLGARDLLLVEGIHAINPRLTAAVDASDVFRLFVCPLAQLPLDRARRVHASDVRLLRRIVRDRHGRNWNAAETIRRWPKVRRGERQHIFPFQAQTDRVFDSSLIYELSVLKVFAERYLLEVAPGDPARATAFRLLALLDRFVPIYPDHVPGTSLLREFIGGSAFDRLRA